MQKFSKEERAQEKSKATATDEASKINYEVTTSNAQVLTPGKSNNGPVACPKCGLKVHEKMLKNANMDSNIPYWSDASLDITKREDRHNGRSQCETTYGKPRWKS